MSILDHIDELRGRIIKIVLGMIIPIVISMIFYEEIFLFLQGPIKGVSYLNDFFQWLGLGTGTATQEGLIKLQSLRPPDTFLAAIKTAIIVGIFVSFPLIVYQIWAFVVPALTDSERTHSLPVVIFSTLFFYLGGSFAYLVALPFTLNFLAEFGSGLVVNQWSIGEYIDFVMQIVLAFGIVFELPLLAFLLAKLGLLKASFLRKYRRFAIVIFLVLAAILTPPDVTSQLIMFFPLMILYEFSIYIAKWVNKASPFDDEE
ncbi:MAG: twin-arginine translocase subunit TatC [Calditrichaeota bacterium]|nr:twin-arginine translocase subunit TatC [Calditrichota bacterium]